MKSKELRVGNWVNHKNENGSYNLLVGEISTRGISVKFNGGGWLLTYDEISPITLNEDTLLKLGFEKVVRDNELYFLKGDCFELHQFNQYGHFSYTCGDNLKGNFVSIRVDSLHQLQNLYFALTDKELDVKF